MSELSQHAKLIKAIEIAKGAQVGIELSYFDVLEVAGELNEAKEVVAMLNARIAELEGVNKRLNSCESALISMVNQFFYSKAGENIFRHSFMSAEEEAAEYLVEHGIARWAGKNKSAICFNEVQE